MNTEKLEKLKKSLDNKFIPDNMKDKIRAEIKKLEADIKTDETITATEVKEEVKEIEKKVEKALEVAEEKEEQAEAKAEEKKEKAPRKAREKKATQSETKTPKVEPKSTAKKKSVFSIAKEIRKDNESWEDAKERARKMMKSETTETKKKTRTETDKLLAMVRRNKEYKKLAGTSNLPKDASRRALPRGKRVSADGNVYYENRANRVDVGGFKNAYLENGGGVDGIIELKPLELIPLSTQLNRLSGYNWTSGDWESEDGGNPSTMPNSVIVNVHTKQKFRLSPFYVYKGIDHYNSKPLYRVEDMSEEGEYVGEWYINREDAVQELKEMFGSYAEKGVYVETLDEEIDLTDDGKPRVIKTQQGGNKSFGELREMHGASPEALAFDNGGSIEDEKFKKFINSQVSYIISLKTISQKREPIKNLLDNMEDYRSGSEIVKRITTDNLKYALQQKTVSKMNEVLRISLNALQYADGGTIIGTPETPLARGLDIDYPGLVGETGGMSAGEMFAEGGSLGNHGLKQGDEIIKTMSGGVQKVKTKSGDIVYVNLANGYRGVTPPLPFAKGGYTNERRHVNKAQDYEVRYAKNKPNRTGYSGKRSLDDGGFQNGVYATGGGVDGVKRFDVYFYKSISDKDTSEEKILRSDSFEDIIENAIKIAKKENYSYIEIYHKGFFIGSMKDKDDYDFKKGRNYENNPLKYATGGLTKNYINRNQLNTITIKKGDKKLTYKVSDVYNGAYKLEDGGNLERTAFYVSKRNVVKVQLKDGKDVKVANGYWIKKGAKPIHTSKYDDGGEMEYANGGEFGKVAFEISNDYIGNLFLGFYDVEINEEFNSSSAFMKYSDAVESLIEYLKSEDGIFIAKEYPKSKFEIDMVSYNSKLDKYKNLEPQRKTVLSVKASMIKDFTEKRIFEDGGQLEMKFLKGGKLESKIQKKVDEVNSLIEKAIDKDGDPIMVIDKSGTWEEPMQYKPIVYKNGRLYFEYYEPYSGKTKKEVVNKSNIEFDGYPMLLDIAKMYRSALKQKGVSFDGGGDTKMVDGVMYEKVKFSNGVEDYYYSSDLHKVNFYCNEHGLNPKNQKDFEKAFSELKKQNKISYKGGGKTTFKEKATAIAKNFEGKKVEPKYQKEYGKTYDKAEAKEVGNKIAGSQKAKYDSKMSGGGSTKRGGAMQLAKQIRKDGESWQSALKRANEQMRKK